MKQFASHFLTEFAWKIFTLKNGCDSTPHHSQPQLLTISSYVFDIRSNKHNLKMNFGFIHSKVIHKHVIWFDNEDGIDFTIIQVLWLFQTLVPFPKPLTPVTEHTTGHSCLPGVAPQHVQLSLLPAKLGICPVAEKNLSD